MPKELSHTAKLNTTPGSCVDCPLPTLRRVSYVFETGLWDDASDSEKSLTIPYAHAINGKIDAAWGCKPEPQKFPRPTSTVNFG